jgi:hypothetical protein
MQSSSTFLPKMPTQQVRAVCRMYDRMYDLKSELEALKKKRCMSLAHIQSINAEIKRCHHECDSQAAAVAVARKTAVAADFAAYTAAAAAAAAAATAAAAAATAEVANAFSAYPFKRRSTAKQESVLIIKQGKTMSDTEQEDMEQWYKENIEAVPYNKTGRYKKRNRLQYNKDCYNGHEKSYIKWCERNKKKPCSQKCQLGNFMEGRHDASKIQRVIWFHGVRFKDEEVYPPVFTGTVDVTAGTPKFRVDRTAWYGHFGTGDADSFLVVSADMCKFEVENMVQSTTRAVIVISGDDYMKIGTPPASAMQLEKKRVARAALYKKNKVKKARYN